MKLLRGVRAVWMSFDEKDWTLIGKDMEDFSMELNPDVSQKKNVFGETSTVHNGYAPSADVEYIARSEDAIYPPIEKIANGLLTDEEHCTAWIIEATLTDEVKESDVKTLTGTGYKAKGMISITSTGGSTEGYSIPFNWQQDGNRQQGTVSVKERKPTFTADAASSAGSGTETSGT